MPAPGLPDALRRFVDDELLRAPLVIDTVIDAVCAQMRAGWSLLSPRDRGAAHDLQQSALARRVQTSQRFVHSLREQVGAELGRDVLAASRGMAAPPRRSSLSLLDDDTVAADIEMSHLIECVKTSAEHELRELATYTSALLGDMDVTRDHNPFRPETYVRALWAAAQEMPAALGFRVAFMRHAQQPLAQVLRKVYAGACSRLEAGGVPAAVYRTVILPPGMRTPRPSESWAGMRPDLNALRDSLPMPLQPVAPPATQHRPTLDPVLAAADHALRGLPADARVPQITTLVDTLRMRLVEHATTMGERQHVELLCRLFEAIVADQRLAADLPRNIATLLVPALRLGLRDASALDEHEHPLWRFIDRTVFLVEQMSGARADHRAGLLAEVRVLIGQLVREPRQDTELYRRALQRLGDWELQRLELDRHRVLAELAPLEALERRLLAAPSVQTAAGALDVGHLDTVPAVLMDSLPQAQSASEVDAARWVARCGLGDWLRIFVQGRWQRTRLLWQSPHGEISLLGDLSGPATWAVRRRALERLYAERLLTRMRPHSLVGAAAARVQRSLETRPAR